MSYIIEDIFNKEYVYEDAKKLVVDERSAYIYKIYRLITGFVKISNTLTDECIELEDDYLSMIYSSPDNFFEKIARYWSDSVDVAYLSNALNNMKYATRNNDFFEQLYYEMAAFHFAVSRKTYTTSFVHIYRMLELISFAFPLLYASKTHDFKTTYGLMKNFFKLDDNAKGELGFFKTAINTLFKDNENVKDISFNIDLRKYGDSNVIDLFSKTCKKTFDAKWLHVDTTEEIIALNFFNVGSAIITLRNRIFHFSNNTSSNLTSMDFGDLDLFFKESIIAFYSWISVLYLEVLKSMYEDFTE